jgi:hypothetical protein
MSSSTTLYVPALTEAKENPECVARLKAAMQPSS